LEKAKEKGLIVESAVRSQYLDREIYNFIFLPGFSTAEKLTNISGRGVGMEVVKRTVSELGGQIEIDSFIGKGSTFRLILPTNVSLIQAIVVLVSSETYVIPLNQIEEIVNTSDFEFTEGMEGQKFFELREKVIPVSDFRKMLSSEFSTQNFQTKSVKCPILIVKANGMNVGFIVDEVSTQQQIVVRKLNGKMSEMEGFMGGTILGDGQPGLILDVSFWAQQFLLGNKSDYRVLNSQRSQATFTHQSLLASTGGRVA
jgi:two-component system, chemotaxis family, sensor kinase CheA